MRLFIAIALPASVRQVLAFRQKPVKGLKWQSAQQLHITLRFCGESSGSTLKELKRALGIIHKPSFNLAVQGVGAFPDKEEPKIVWAGVEKAVPLLDLQHDIEQICRNCGFSPETGQYIPHITLARVKSHTFDFAKFYSQQRIAGVDESFRVNNFGLYRSQTGTEGAVHTRLQMYALSK